MMWASAVWRAAVAPDRALFTVQELARMYAVMGRKLDEHCTWRRSREPITRVVLCSQRIGRQPNNVSMTEEL
eukprot:8154248-Pyramimonas_sp.AAC.1